MINQYSNIVWGGYRKGYRRTHNRFEFSEDDS